MNIEESKRFRASLADTIGDDIVYVSAADKDKHFDAISFIQTYGGELFLISLLFRGNLFSATFARCS
jgi:hypothetical protein